MKTIQITVRLDTPLLLGGSVAGQPETTLVLRPASLRGLFRTFARAHLGYMLGNVGQREKCIRVLESSLLGAAAESGIRGNTYRIAIAASELLRTGESQYANVPKSNGDEHGSSPGFEPGQKQTIIVTIPSRSTNAKSASGNPHFSQAFQSVCWLALTLGSLGKRSRRGYGSLSIESMSTGALGRDLEASELPSFSDAADADALAAKMNHGIELAVAFFRDWIQYEEEHNKELISLLSGMNDVDRGEAIAKTKQAISQEPNYQYEAGFFQFGGVSNVYVSEPTDESRTLVEKFNDACHEFSSNETYANAYRKYIGLASKRGRLASPVWMRVHHTAAGYVAVITVSPPANSTAETIWKGLVDSVAATSIATRCS